MGIVFRQVVNIAGDEYAIDIYDSPPGALSPGDELVLQANISPTQKLYIFKKAKKVPPPQPEPTPPAPTPTPTPIPPTPTPTPVPPTPPPTTTTNVDTFGVTKVYADGTGGSNWTMNMSDPMGDPRAKNPESSGYPPKFTKNSDGSWKIKNQTEIRWAINQDNGFNQSKICTDFQKCQAQGFMQDNMDWGTPPNGLEMTQYVRINSISSSTKNGEGHIEAVMKGWRSTTGDQKVGPCNCAIGCSNNYHGNIYNNKGKNGSARQKWECDLKHTSGYKSDINGVNNNSAYQFKLGQFQGFKTIVYNINNGQVQLEHWTDEDNTNRWKKTHSFVDDGHSWQPRNNADGCNVPKVGNAITFGGPICCFRSDNLTDYDLKNCSIRSIDPTKKMLGVAHVVNATTDHPANPEDVILENDNGTLTAAV